MAPKKKKASGDAAKGEKVFKNLCGVCHSLSVSFKTFVLTRLAPTPEDFRWLSESTFNWNFWFLIGKCSIGSLNWSCFRWNRWFQYRLLWRVLLLFIPIIKSYFEMVGCQLGQMAKSSSWFRSRKRHGLRWNPIDQRQSWPHCLSHGLKHFNSNIQFVLCHRYLIQKYFLR